MCRGCPFRRPGETRGELLCRIIDDPEQAWPCHVSAATECEGRALFAEKVKRILNCQAEARMSDDKPYKAAVCIDSWKESIFSEELKAAGYSYTVEPGVTRDTITLSVPYRDQSHLEPVVRKAMERAENERRKRSMH